MVARGPSPVRCRCGPPFQFTTSVLAVSNVNHSWSRKLLLESVTTQHVTAGSVLRDLVASGSQLWAGYTGKMSMYTAISTCKRSWWRRLPVHVVGGGAYLNM